MDDEKKDSSNNTPLPHHDPSEYAAPASPEEKSALEKNPASPSAQQGTSNGPKSLDSKSKKALIASCVTVGVLLALMATFLSVGFIYAKEQASQSEAADVGYIINGFYDQNGKRISDGGSYSYSYVNGTKPTFALKGITVTSEEATSLILPYAYSSEESNNTAYYVSQTVETASGNNLFGEAGAKNVTTIYAERYYTSLGAYCFSGLTSLQSFQMSNTVTSGATTTFGNYAFSGDSALTKVALPNTLIALGDGVFQNCAKLNSVILSSNLTSIGTNAFAGATSLTKLTYQSTKDDFKKKVTCGANWHDATLVSLSCVDGDLTL
jgi:hypothetical protein